MTSDRAAMLKRWHNGQTGLNPVNPNPMPWRQVRAMGYGPGERVPARGCGCACTSGGFCGGCGHAGCGGR